MPVRQRAYAKKLEEEISKGKGLTVAGHKKAIKRSTMKPKKLLKSKIDNESWVSRLKGKVKAYFGEEKAKKRAAEEIRQARLKRKREKDEAIIAKARARGARI